MVRLDVSPGARRSRPIGLAAWMATAVAFAAVAGAPTSASVAAPSIAEQKRATQVVYSTDVRGDEQNLNGETGGEPTVDINRLVLSREKKRAVVFKTRFADMVSRQRNYANSHVLYIRTPKTRFTIVTQPGNTNQCERAGGPLRRCPSIRWRLNSKTSTHVLTVPYRVLDNPRWIRMRGDVQVGSLGSDVYAHRGPANTFDLPFGPRFYR